MDPKELLLKHFEKLIAGVFGAWLIFTVVNFIGMKPKELSQSEQLAKNLEQIDSHMANFEVKLDPLSDPTKDLKHQLDPSEVPQADSFGPWLAHRRPTFLYNVFEGAKKTWPTHKPPLEFRVTDKARKR